MMKIEEGNGRRSYDLIIVEYDPMVEGWSNHYRAFTLKIVNNKQQ